MSGPVLQVDLDAIEQNVRSIVTYCQERNISVTGVTKVTCGMPAVARALLRGGVNSLGESRLENIHRMEAQGITAPFWLLRIPSPSAVEEIVHSVSISLNSEIGTIRALSTAAERLEIIHDIVLMIDLGDLREGLWPGDILPTVREILKCPGIRLRGLGTNLTCYGGVLPSETNMQALVDYKKRVEDSFNLELDILSGGNSSTLDLLLREKLPKEINNLRLGESLMLGKETAYHRQWPGTRLDAFILKAELIEIKEKPSVPLGEMGLDAFGKKPTFEDRGTILRGILNLGREDVSIDGLTPQDGSLRILGASSDHLLVDITSRRGEVSLGQELSFLLDYGALLAAMTSNYVKKEPHQSGRSLIQKRPQLLFTGDAMDSLLLKGKTVLREYLEKDLQAIPSLSGIIRDQPGRTSLKRISSDILPLLCSKTGKILSILEDYALEGGSVGLLWLTPRIRVCPLWDYLQNPSLRPQLTKSLPLENCVIIGLKEADPPTQLILRDRQIRTYTMEDIDLRGIHQVLREAMFYGSAGVDGFFLRYDPSLTEENNEGLTRRETYLAMELIARSHLLRGVDLSDVPFWKNSSKTLFLHRYIATALGRKILGG